MTYSAGWDFSSDGSAFCLCLSDGSEAEGCEDGGGLHFEVDLSIFQTSDSGAMDNKLQRKEDCV